MTYLQTTYNLLIFELSVTFWGPTYVVTTKGKGGRLGVNLNRSLTRKTL